MKIGVFGDSFAEIESKKHTSIIDESWITILKNEGYNVTCFGKAGSSIWYSYEKFLYNHGHFDVNIFVYSHHNRIHSLPEYLTGFNSLRCVDDIYRDTRYKNLQDYQHEELKAILNSYIFTQNNTLDRFVANQVFSEVNKISMEHGSRIINILPFVQSNDNMIDLSLRKGPCLMGLHEITKREESKFKITPKTTDTRSCHLTFENNMALTKLLKPLMSDNNMDVVELIDRPEFTYDISHMRYFKE